MPNFTRFLPEKLSIYPNLYDICPKIYKIPEFYMFFCPKMSEFYIIIARKIFFPNFRGHLPLPLPPVFYAYATGQLYKSQFVVKRDAWRSGPPIPTMYNVREHAQNVGWRRIILFAAPAGVVDRLVIVASLYERAVHRLSVTPSGYVPPPPRECVSETLFRLGRQRRPRFL